MQPTDLAARLRSYIPGIVATGDHGFGGLLNDITEAAAAILAQAERIAKLEVDLRFHAKWVERGLFDRQIAAKEALSVIAHYPGMPWKNQRWDVDHKPYAKVFYAEFPRAALADTAQGDGM